MFRFRKLNVHFAPPQSIFEDVEHHEIVNGVDVVTFVKQDCQVSASQLPNPADYKLSTLLASGVPMNVIPTDMLSDTPTSQQIDSIVGKLSDTPKN